MAFQAEASPCVQGDAAPVVSGVRLERAGPESVVVIFWQEYPEELSPGVLEKAVLGN